MNLGFFQAFGYPYSANCTVDCWFCLQPVTVPRGTENSFTCNFCDQYNGFTEDGGYNKLIASQFDTASPNKNFRSSYGNFTSDSDILCSACSLKQNIIIKKLADFEPRCQENWNAELKEFRDRLEQVYPLCTECLVRSKNRIREVDKALLPTFLEWWNKFRNNYTPSSQLHLASKCPQVPNYSDGILPSSSVWLLARFCSAFCYLVLVVGPLVTYLIDQHCAVHTQQKITTLDWLMAHLKPKQLQVYVQPYCESLLNWSTFLVLPLLEQFWFTLLLFVLQTILVFASWSAYTGKTRHLPRTSPLVLLLDVSLLLFVTNFLLFSVSSIFLSPADTHDSNMVRVYGYVIIAIVLTPLLLSVCSGVTAWFAFCSTNLKTQRQALKHSWPLRHSTYSRVSDDSIRSGTRSTLSYNVDSTPSSFRAIGNNSVPEFGSSFSISSPKPYLRPPILSWPPSQATAFGSLTASVGPRTTFIPTFRSVVSCPQVLRDDCDGSDDSLVTSVSRLMSHPRPSRSNSCGRGRKSRTRKNRHRKHSGGLIRFFLSLLFGRVETFADVLSELICFANALLVGVVIYSVICLFMRLVNL
ncbi:Transmembrane protein [Paragonimus heterotremus]|uniref:Transmembrane protein n=1 Tax=Paragonimus heterotremus TaxID=100268 RepID=A0A8J4WI67_9TREM|nr:Transmembrane protein [Paragonimus heterotremus]